jgi:replicative DNA helicase
MQAEQALLGALLANNKAYERVSEFLAPEHFADPIHGAIFQPSAADRGGAARRRRHAARGVRAFRPAGRGRRPAYLAQLLTAMVGIINAGEYGRVVFDCFLRRQLIDLGEVVVNRAFGAEPGSSTARASWRRRSRRSSTREGRRHEGGFVTFERALTDAVELAERAFSHARRRLGLVHGPAGPRQRNSAACTRPTS